MTEYKMEYTISHNDDVHSITLNIDDAYKSATEIKYKTLYTITEYDEENDSYISVNLDTFVFFYENGGLLDFSTFEDYY